MAASSFLQFYYFCRYRQIRNELILPRLMAGRFICISEDIWKRLF